MSISRRAFFGRSAVVAAAAGYIDLTSFGEVSGTSSRVHLPWYRRALRWGQTNINERDPTHYDISFWRDYWRRTRVQAIIVNAGGIVAYYPSKFPLQRRAQFLGNRDLFGDLTKAARSLGIAVIARMDSGGAGEDFHAAHPDWFVVDAEGKPVRSRDLFVPCINGPYFREYLPDVLREIAEQYHPEGFTDNSWAGAGRGTICHCEHCARKFRDWCGYGLPERRNWSDAAYRAWIGWSYRCRLEIWDLNNKVAQEAGGPGCLWAGMNSGSISGQCQSFRDYKAICERSEIVLLDHQARSDNSGFEHNSETGKLIHGLLGWEKLIPESMAMYQAGRSTFRFSAKPAEEARLWMIEGFAGGIQPWWHHLGAAPEDRRAFETAEPINRWHEANEEFLINRKPLATVGVVWSQQNTDFYGRDDADFLVEQPWRGLTQALVRARIPYLPIHADHIQREAPQLAALVLPNTGSLTDSQEASIRKFVERGGGLLATGEASRYDEWGDSRADFALADLFGAHVPQSQSGADNGARHRGSADARHTYLRIDAGGGSARQRAHGGSRHPVLRGFEETDILPFGGTLEELRVASSAQVVLTFVPAFPVFPPESVWMREPRTGIPGLVINERRSGGRVAYLPADLDRCYARDHLPDHANLLANLVRWIARDRIPLSITGAGLMDCHLYHQPGRLILHMVNLTNEGAWRAPIDELISVGPFTCMVTLPDDVQGREVRLLVSNRKARPSGTVTLMSRAVLFRLDAVRDHEVAVIS